MGGCQSSEALAPPKSEQHQSGGKKGKRNANKDSGHHNPLAAGTGKTHPPENHEAPTLVGKHKYIIDVGAVVMQNTQGVLVVFGSAEGGIAFAFRDTKLGSLYQKEWSDSQLLKEKDGQGISHGWAPLFKSIASDITKNKATINHLKDKMEVIINVTSSKDPKIVQPFTIKLDMKGKHPHQRDLFKYIVEPMTRMVQKRRANVSDKEKELRCAKVHCGQILKAATSESSKLTIERLQPVIYPLREQATVEGKNSAELQNKVASAERKMRRLRLAKEGRQPLDTLYDDGGPRYFWHLSHADEHVPKVSVADETIIDLIQNVLPIRNGGSPTTLTKALGNPQIARLMNGAPAGMAQGVLQTLSKLDAWDYNVFSMNELTDNNALFFTTYALMYKMDLVNHFNLDDKILRNFLGAVQAGYHPNPYHNATHAADVAQVNYFIMMVAGLSKQCQLTQEDILAGIIAGAIHDYDHPGFNNNFHTRTNAYLSTLYNDRSILENHHCACIFEMLKLPQYDILAPLSEDQRREVRDTVIEMVLATDMGNHAKIFASFRRRLTEGTDWHTRKEDIRLALSMSIKMADISNCGRPNFLYVEWAKNIALEFYNQGDVEAKLKLPISPFMDRKKDSTDFPKGQISFMNYIVMPMLEALAEFLPSMEFSVTHCTENKDYWQKNEK